MKRTFFILLTIFTIIFINKASAYTQSFDLLINVMGIEKTNINGKSLNEEIYNNYQLFVYGSPQDGYSEQRFKPVIDGNCIQNNVRGEYWILGENVNGLTVHNHKFPVDVEPPTSPENWRYAILSDALNSWNLGYLHMDDQTKEYMLNTKLTRNNIEYNLTVLDIGLNKVRLDNYATWKTKGSVYTQRYDKNNKRWAANFMVPAMSADASLDGYAYFPNGTTYYINQDDIAINIPINYGARAINLTDYAKKEHVKNISSKLYVNDVMVNNMSSQEVLEISGDYIEEHIPIQSTEPYTIKIRIESILLTKFSTDGALTDIKEYELLIIPVEYESGEESGKDSGEVYEEILNDNPFIPEETHYNSVDTSSYFAHEEAVPPYIEKITIKRIINGREVPLLISKKSGMEFICAGQTITIETEIIGDTSYVNLEFAGDSSIYTFDQTTKNFEWTEPRNRNIKTFFSKLSDFEKMYKEKKKMTFNKLKDEETSIYTYKYIIPYETKQTLESWSTLREKSKDAFNIDEQKLFNRIKNPYTLVITAGNSSGHRSKTVTLDIFERWDTLYNRDISYYVK